MKSVRDDEQEHQLQGITPLQLWLAALFPTVFAIGTMAVSIVGLIINNSRFNSVDARLLKIENKLTELGECVTRVEMQH